MDIQLVKRNAIFRTFLLLVVCQPVYVVKYFNSANDVIAFRLLSEEFWRWRLEQVPEFATSLGVDEHDERLETYTMEAFTHRKEKCDELLFRLNDLELTSLPAQDRRNMVLLRDNIETYIEGYRWSRLSPLNPLNSMEGLHKDFTFWTDAMTFQEAADFRSYIQRMRALATQVNEQIALMREAIRTGWINHVISLDTVLQSLDAFLDLPAISTPFFRPFNDSMEYLAFSINKIDRLRSGGEAVIEDQVLPAYRKLRIFLVKEYLPSTRHNIGIYSLSGGEQFYRDCITWYLAEHVTPTEIHQVTVAEVQKLRWKLDKLRMQHGFSGSLDGFIRYVKKDAQFFYVSEDEILEKYEDVVSKLIPQRIGWIFKNITILPMVVQPMPFDGPDGVAMPPSEDLTMPGVLFINVRKPHRRPKWQMLSLALREALPGQHFQTSYTRNQSIPVYLRTQEFRKMHSIPFQFPFHSAFIEGWSLYAGSLGHELGLYANTMDEFGQLYAELESLVKAVVDTGIHTFGWSRDDSVRYIASNTGEASDKCRDRVDAIITLPGQALAEPWALLKIKRLRSTAIQLLGNGFNLAEFHHYVLHQGPVSLRSMEYSVNTWLSTLAPQYLSHNTATTHQTQTYILLLSIMCYIYIALYGR